MWKVLCKDDKSKSNDIRWVCKCGCGTVKSVLGKYLKNGKSKSCGCGNKVSLDGSRFGALLVEETIYGYNGYNKATYKCLCDCGNVVYIKSSSIYKQKSCGCSRRRDLTGKTFGKLTVQKMLYKYDSRNATYCDCKCECGKHIITRANGLITGNTKSCGCVHSPDLTGKEYGKLIVVGYSTQDDKWICRCACGRETLVRTKNLNSGITTSCGCSRSERVSIGESTIRDYLCLNNIEFETEKSFAGCKGIGGKLLRFDFYIPYLRTVIEYDGVQHYEPKEWFGGNDAFIKLKKNDEIKNNYCNAHNINLIRIPYTYSKEKLINHLEAILSDPVTITVV